MLVLIMTIQIFVQGPTGPLACSVELRMTGLDIKVMLAEKFSVPVKHIWLSYNGGIVYNNSILVDLGMQWGDTIRCYIR